MKSNAQAIALALLVIAFCATPHVASNRDAQKEFAVVDTRQGAIRHNVFTGDSWLLDTTGDPVWRAIGIDDATTAETQGLSFDDIEWVIIMSSTGEESGLRVKRFTRKIALKSIAEGDVITAVNGTKVGSVADLRREWRKSIEAREPIKLTILRDGEEITVESAFDAKYPFE